MKNTFVVASALLAVLLLAGCGGKKAEEGSTPAASQTATPAPAAGGDYVVPADLDQGPRANATPVDEAKAEEGEKLFQTKGCTACHAIGKRMSGPDLAGVTSRRTARWMESQILHPDKMTKQDPISKDLFAKYMLQMPNQGLTPEQAQAVIEYLKKEAK